ncbi:flagellar assembly protein FliH [Variovorax sp. YR216]|uniref:flagellar assembly protein FliH n=1 Tax=Variovorax sp. YR216 TaxID=1882828 RepID=UPI00089D8B24|nr:flagellar assembly protein FliH [Variovorax sp. YR216]SEA42297.1 flagellar assembly protein FliH [Variovorax sp. YR216]
MTLSKQARHAFAPGARALLASAYAPPATAAPAAAPQPSRPGKPVLSAWQRWEMDTLTEAQPADASQRAAAAPAEVAPSPALLHAAELAQLRREARAAGEAEGRKEGLAKGHAQGLAQGHTEGVAAGLAAASAHAEQLRAIASSLPAALHRAESEVADALLTLALDIARQVVHRTLRAEPEWVLPLVQELLHAEPALQGEPRLLLHPDDVALVKNSLGNELEAAGWHVRADETMTRGGCRVQSASGELDASLETRWKNVTAALHRDADAQGT